MKVLLARPNSKLKVVPPPVGLGYLSHALKTARGDHTLIIDGRRRRLSPEDIVSEAQSFAPDAIGVTAMTFEAPEALELIRGLKSSLPEVPVIMGGPHATGFGPSLLERMPADYLVLGEGEDTFVGLLDALEGKKDLAGVRGVARRVDGEVQYTGPGLPIEDMERLKIDWDAVRPQDYFSWWTRNAMNTVARGNRRLPVFFTRGCPMGCAYCHHIFGRKFRTFPIESKVEEMVQLRDRYNLEEFEIIDDSFNLKIDHAKAAMRRIIDQNLNTPLTFTNGLRADRMDEELLDLMVRAGTYRLDYAIESASPRIQTLINKNLDLDRARQVVNMTAKKGIVTGTYFMLGFPGETEDEMAATIDYAVSLDNHIASFFYLMPFPGTQISESSPQLAKKVRELTFGDASGIALNLSDVPDSVMQQMRKAGNRRFYFSAKRAMRIFRDVPKSPRLLASALAVLRLSFQEAIDY